MADIATIWDSAASRGEYTGAMTGSPASQVMATPSSACRK